MSTVEIVLGCVFAFAVVATVFWTEGNSRGWQSGFSAGCELYRDLRRFDKPIQPLQWTAEKIVKKKTRTTRKPKK